MLNLHLISDQSNPLLFGIILPSFIGVGIVISHSEDPYEPISTMECHEGFHRCSFGKSRR